MDGWVVRRVSPLLNWSTLERIYPRYPHINDIRILERVRGRTDQSCRWVVVWVVVGEQKGEEGGGEGIGLAEQSGR